MMPLSGLSGRSRPTCRDSRWYLCDHRRLGDLGLAVAERLVARGARSLALIGLSAATAVRRDTIQTLEAKGATVRVIMADVTSAEQMAEAFADVTAAMPPVGLFHAAGVLDGGVLVKHTAKRFASVMAPKVDGAWNLCKLLADRPTVDLILSSSIASLLGLPGQGSYAAGNAFLTPSQHIGERWEDGRRRSTGDHGMISALQQHNGREASSSPPAALVACRPRGRWIRLSELLGCSLVALRSWRQIGPRIKRRSGRAKLAFLTILLADIGETSAPPNQSARNNILTAAPGAPRRTAIEAAIKQQLAHVLRQSANRIDTARPFRNLGLNLSMGLELRNRLEFQNLHIRLADCVSSGTIRPSERWPHILNLGTRAAVGRDGSCASGGAPGGRHRGDTFRDRERVARQST